MWILFQIGAFGEKDRQDDKEGKNADSSRESGRPCNNGRSGGNDRGPSMKYVHAEGQKSWVNLQARGRAGEKAIRFADVLFGRTLTRASVQAGRGRGRLTDLWSKLTSNYGHTVLAVGGDRACCKKRREQRILSWITFHFDHSRI